MSKKSFFSNGKFHNTHGSHPHSIVTILKWLICRKKGPWPQKISVTPSTPPTSSQSLQIIFVNHSTLLIQWHGVNILTDPIWSNSCNPFPFFGPYRVHEPGIRLEDLPHIDLILLSHNHYDHLDQQTLKKIIDRDHSFIITGLGNLAYLRKRGFKHIRELDWWEKESFKDIFEIIFLPAQHFSMRNPLNRNKTLWGGFAIKHNDKYVYFAGDTGYYSIFKDIRDKFGSPEVSLLPIGAYEPRWFMKENHMNPEDAVQAHVDLGSKKSIAIHHGTFQLADEAFEEPKERLQKELARRNIPSEDFIILSPGECFSDT